MRHFQALALGLVAALGLAGCGTQKVGEVAPGVVRIPSDQLIQPAGESLSFTGRPVDMAFGKDGRRLYVKDDEGITVVDVDGWKVQQRLAMKGGTSLHGICVSADGKFLYASDAAAGVVEGEIASDGQVAWKRTFEMLKPKVGGSAYPIGLLPLEDGKMAVALSRSNEVAVLDLASGKVEASIPVDVAPYGLARVADGSVLVGCWAATPREKVKTAPSSGTPVEVDERGIGVGGTVCVVDLTKKTVNARIPVGLQPCDIQVQGGKAYVANANSDTVSVLDLTKNRVERTIFVKPDAKLPFGSAPNALAFAPNDRMFVACGGNNAVAQVKLGGKPAVQGFVPAGWYPNALLLKGDTLYVANAKGNGSRGGKNEVKRLVYEFEGTITRFPLPDAPQLKKYTAQVTNDLDVPRILRARERSGNKTATAVPVPQRLGDPSTIEHVVYILKENRTYDQVLGDIGKGESDPSLCIYGEEVTPNTHALANEFVLLDNYYCNGVNSADGHAWSMEGNATAYFEKTFGGWTRSYPYGDDPLSVSSSGYLWDSVLARGLSFRNYGEFDYAEPIPKGQNYAAIYKDFVSGARTVKFSQNIGVERLRNYSCPDYPGWNLNIPDVLRADIFLKELAQFEKKGDLPNLTIVYLPQDHTSGRSPGGPSPRALVADNDLAVGRVIEGLSKSRFWPKTCVFVIEDDPQDGFDHVDGHRSTCLVVSPYTKRKAIVSEFYNQTSMLHTMQQMLGVAPMNQMVARSRLMTACFTDKPNLTPYTAIANKVPLDEINPPLKSLTGLDRELALASMKLPLDKPDQGSDDLKNRILWHAAKGASAKYPAALAGAHGKGLGKLGLKLDRTVREEEEDEDDD